MFRDASSGLNSAAGRTRSSAASAICDGDEGRYGDIEGVWMPPVTAHVMMTLRIRAYATFWILMSL
jgi:hypothetical protein